MKKLIYFAAILLLSVNCSRNTKSENGKADSIRIADSLATMEAEALKLAEELETARLDSIRQDSIAEENRMRLNPRTFKSLYPEDESKTLKKMGFKKIKEDLEYDEEIGEFGQITYSRTFNGRRIDYIRHIDTCTSAYLKFYDKTDRDNFLDDMLKEGYKKRGEGEYVLENEYSYIGVNGNEFQVGDCS